MKISLVMVCKDSQDTIAASINSFLKQDWADVELVVIDGESSDQTCDIVRSFDCHRIRLFSGPDDGIFDAINKGVLKCEGDVIGILHSNDQLATHDVLSTVAAAFEDPELDAVYADVGYFNAKRPERITRIFRSSRFRADRMAWGRMLTHTTLYLRRDVFSRFGLYKTNYRFAGDFEFVARLFHGGDVRARYIPQILTYMQSGGASTAGILCKFPLNREVMRACRENDINTNYFKLLSKYPLKLLETLPRPGQTERRLYWLSRT